MSEPSTPQPNPEPIAPRAQKPAAKPQKDWTPLGSVRDSFAVCLEQDLIVQRPSFR